MAQADPSVVNGRPHPDRPAVGVGPRRAPETDVMALPRIVSHGLLEGEVLLASAPVEAADRGVVIGPAKTDASAISRRLRR